jgi:AraC-like DNA-binding protein
MRLILPSPITPCSASALADMISVAPARDLADVVEQHWVVRWDRRRLPALRRELLPDPSVNLVVEPCGVLLYGVGSGHGVRELRGRGMVIGTKFRPGGFSGFRPGPVSAISGHALTMFDAFGPAGTALDGALAAAHSDVRATIVAVSSFLRAQRPAVDPQRTLVMAVLEAMRAAEPGVRVGELAAHFAIAPRTMQRLFASHVGASPKQVLQRLRRQRAIDHLSDEPVQLAQLAAALGYFDQAHLARDFRATLGRSPSAISARTARRDHHA